MTTLNSPAARLESLDPRANASAGSTGLVLQDTYTLGMRIGEGGMGEVYEASHVRLPGRFAVKILRPDLLTNPEAIARFCREAEIMSELRHPHIIQIFDFNTSVAGLPYFVMEYLDGIDLETRMTASGALPLSDVVPIVEAVASALGAAHAMGVVHRDLKPANIFLIHGEGQDDDFVKVIDFGISKTAGPGPRLSRASEIMGTPAFMSPEQALGLTAQIDARTDQFALAGIATLMLTGHEPFAGTDPVSLLYQVVHEAPVPLARFLSWDTSLVQSVLDRALAKRREDRFDSIAAFASALAAAAGTVTNELTPPAAIPVVEPVPAAPAALRPVLRLVRLPRPLEEPAPPEELQEEDAPPPIRPRATPPVVRSVEAVVDAELPRSLDRVPHGPQRAVALGLAVLALGAVIVHKGWYEGFPRRAVSVERDLIGRAERPWRTEVPSPLPSASGENLSPL
jgi:serine/threonine protein kinase